MTRSALAITARGGGVKHSRVNEEEALSAVRGTAAGIAKPHGQSKR